MRITPFTALLALLLAGCFGQDDKGAIQSLSSDNANQLSSNHSRFETSKDPPISAESHLAAGMLAETSNNLAGAIEQYALALKLDPRHERALYRTGVLQTKLKDFPRAMETWKQYVKVTNGSASGYSNLAFCCELAGKPGDAEEAYKQGIKREPTNQPCRINYGLMLARIGRRDEAITQLSAVLKPAEVHYNLASVYEQMNKRDAARTEYEKALELDPQLWEAQSRLSKLE